MKVKCHVCKNYDISDAAISYSAEWSSDTRAALSAIVRRRYDLDQKQERIITEDNYQVLISQAPDRNDVPSKVRYLLGYIAHKSRFPGDMATLTGLIDYPICFAANEGEFSFYFQHAIKAGFIEELPSGTHVERNCCLTPKGWEEAERIPTLESPYAFVAMSFSKEGERGELLTKAFEGAIRPAIEKDAGYKKAIRIDKEEFLGDIVFEIIARIKECRFVVADVTDHRNGVYFEGGYAMGMGLPVIWTCHKDHMKTAHFDTNHMNHIEWDDIGELRKSLANRILGTSIGRGPKRRSGD